MPVTDLKRMLKADLAFLKALGCIMLVVMVLPLVAIVINGIYYTIKRR